MSEVIGQSGAGAVRAPGAPLVGDGKGVWAPPGKVEAMPIASLPEAPPSMHILGPAMVLVALGVGLGETYLWPRLVIVFGPGIRWLMLIGVSVQAVVMMEMGRYALATGESIFFGIGRVFKPFMWFFFTVAILVYIWPGHMSEGAQAFENLTGIPWLYTAIVGMLLVGIFFTVAKYVYNYVENILTFLIGFLVIGSAVTAGLVGTWGDVGKTLEGMFEFGYLPSRALTATWFPVIVGSVAFAGPSGMQQMWYTLWLRDKGAGMGSHIPRVRGLLHSGEEETVPSRGFMFDTDNPDEMRKWKDWRRWVGVDAILLFWGVTMLTTIVFTVLAQEAARVSPVAKQNLLAGDQSASLTAMSNAFSAAGGAVLGTLFFVFIAVVGFKGSLGLFDAFARGQSDMTYFFVPGAKKKFNISQLYGIFLWGVIIFGIIILVWGPADGPQQILNVLAFLSTAVMGLYCVALLFTNNRNLPKKIRPGIITNAIIAFGACFYLGMLIFSLLKYGVVVG